LLTKNLKIRICKTIILPVVLYGCETWSLTLREEHRLGVSENRVLMRISGPKRDEVTGEWTKLHNEELHDLYSSPSIIRIIKARTMRWAGHVARIVLPTPIGRSNKSLLITAARFIAFSIVLGYAVFKKLKISL
jgi:hypothetical protein